MGHDLFNGGSNGQKSNGKYRESRWVGSNDALSFSAMFRRLGLKAEADGELKSAFRLYKKALRANPDDVSNWFNYGTAALAVGEVSEAAEALTEVLNREPGSANARYLLARALAETGEYGAAATHLEQLVEIDPRLEDPMAVAGLSAIIGLAICQAKLGNWREAMDTLRPSLGLAVLIFRNLGDVSWQGSRWEDAARYYKLALLLKDDDPGLLHGAGYALMQQGYSEEASGFLKGAVRLEPNVADYWYDLGIALSRLKRRKEARRCFNRTLRIDPKYAWAYYDLACLDALEKKHFAAFKNLNTAVDLGFRKLDYMLTDKDFVGIRKDPRWKMVVDRIKFVLE